MIDEKKKFFRLLQRSGMLLWFERADSERKCKNCDGLHWRKKPLKSLKRDAILIAGKPNHPAPDSVKKPDGKVEYRIRWARLLDS